MGGRREADVCIRKVLGEKDVLKVDIGVHVKGRICDSAFTLSFDPTYEKLLEAVKAATDTGVRVRILRSCSHVVRRTHSGWPSALVTRKQASTYG